MQSHYQKVNIWCVILRLFFFLSSFLFKPSADFFKGKTVFNHWLPGICYSNITFQLVSEATFNKSTLVEYSGVQHEPKQHRTGKENSHTLFLPSLYCCCGEGTHPTESRVCVGGGYCGCSIGSYVQTVQREICVSASIKKLASQKLNSASRDISSALC